MGSNLYFVPSDSAPTQIRHGGIMCGIAGEIRFDGAPVDLSVIEKMNARQAQRGPDDSGCFATDVRAFGHRRLMVMDLTPRSQQPLFDPQVGLGIVFNGAIYNHNELRAELQLKGHTFFSTGDTEVVLRAYAQWGANCVKHFQGMFAFAVWERDSGRTFLARDRLGIKPLYFSATSQRFRFASSLPALCDAGDVDTSIDPIALNYYLNFHAVVPPPHTILNGVRKLRPGTTLTISREGSLDEQTYWSLSFSKSTDNYSETEWRDQLLAKLRVAVKRRLVAAIDVGVLLSGGVDSSLLVGLIAEAGISKFKTFSVGFESIGDEAGDEFHYSDIVAETFSTEHNKFRISSEEMLEHLSDAIHAMSEPMVSHDCIGFYLLSREVSRTCKAVQSGQGADEVFGGYHWYPPLIDSANPFATYRKAFFDRDFAEYLETVSPAMAGNDAAGDFVKTQFSGSQAIDPVDKALHLDTTVMLVDDPVKRVDNMTMSWGLEGRVPFLDHELVEFAAKMPASMKLAGDGKYILKEAARSVVPAAVIDRPKGYFPVPALKYLRGSVLEYVSDALTCDAAKARGLFNSRYVSRLLAAPEDHITPLRGSKLWQLGLLELWLQEQGV